MYKQNNNKLKKYLGALLLSICLALTTLVSYLPTNRLVTHADVSHYKEVITNELIDQATFKTTSTTFPDESPRDWDKIEDKESDLINKDNIISGIVSLHNEYFSNSELKTTNPGSHSGTKDLPSNDEYYMNLMINSHTGPGKMGYRSSTFPLEANSYYKVSVLLLTQDSAQASIYLDGLVENKDLEDPHFEMINTNGEWEYYDFYLDTDEKQTDISLELWLGSHDNTSVGTVFVNNVSVTRYSEDLYSDITEAEYNNRENSGYVSKSNILSYSPVQNLNPVLNSSFEDNTSLSTTWKTVVKSSSNNLTQYNEIVKISNFDKFSVTGLGSNCSPNNSFALLMYNGNSLDYQTIQSSNIVIKPKTYYKLTVWAWSDNVDTAAHISVIDNTPNVADEDKKEAVILEAKDFSAKNDFRNNWKEFTFFIYGDANETKEIALNISLGTNEHPTSGYMFFDDVRLQNVTSTYYEDNKGSDNTTSMQFGAADATDAFMFSNSLFNLTNDDEKYNIPTPSNWTYSSIGHVSNSNAYHGIINTSIDDFNTNKSLYGGNDPLLKNPGATPLSNSNNNVLMIGNNAEDISQTYTSSEITLASNKYYRLSYYVYTSYNNDNNDNGLRIAFTDTNKNVIYNHYNIDHSKDNKWHLYEVYIKTGDDSISGNLSINLENVYGYVFLDNVICEELESDDDDINIFDNHYTHNENNTEIILDLSNESFESGIFGKNYSVTSTSKWTGTTNYGAEPTKAGLLNTTNAKEDPAFIGINVPNAPTGENVLYIKSLNNIYYTFTSKKEFTFTAKTYYKISVLINTENIGYDTEATSNEFTSKIGASIRLTNSTDICFEGIENNKLDKTGFVEYSIYVCLENDLTSTIDLSLGCADISTFGTVYFDNLLVTELSDETAYNTDKEAKSTALYKEYINYTPENTEQESSDEDPFVNDFNWLTIPSIITALSILIAILGFYIRKINIKVSPRIKTTYDRRKTLDKSIDRKEKIALRKQIIEELTKELEDIDKELEEFRTLSNQKIEDLKAKVANEKDSINKHKFELEIRRKELVSTREKDLKENPELIKDKRAEKEFTQYIAKLDKQEIQLQKSLESKDFVIEQELSKQETYIKSFSERQQIIKDEILKIEEEIAQIQREEEIMWDEYAEAKKKVKANDLKKSSKKSKK